MSPDMYVVLWDVWFFQKWTCEVLTRMDSSRQRASEALGKANGGMDRSAVINVQPRERFDLRTSESGMWITIFPYQSD